MAGQLHAFGQEPVQNCSTPNWHSLPHFVLLFWLAFHPYLSIPISIAHYASVLDAVKGLAGRAQTLALNR